MENVEKIVHHKSVGYYEEKFEDIQLLLNNATNVLLKEHTLLRRPKLGEIILDYDAKLFTEHLRTGRYYFSIVIETLPNIQNTNHYVRVSGVMYVISARLVSMKRLTDKISAYATNQIRIFTRDGVILPQGVKHTHINLSKAVMKSISVLVDKYCDMAIDCTSERKHIYIASLFIAEIIRIEEVNYFIKINLPVPENTFNLETERFLDENSSEDILEHRETQTLGNASKFVEFNKPNGVEKRLNLLTSVGRNA